MAAKRIGKSAVNWAKMAERVPEEQKMFFNALKLRSDGYLRRVMSNPEAPPKLDFSAYKSKIPIAGLVESFQKQYDAFKVPYPSENLTPKIAEQEAQAAKDVKEFIVQSNKRIEEYNKTLDKWDHILPFEDMTMEDFRDAFPDIAHDPINRPTLWPHDPECQPGYVPPEGTVVIAKDH